jgi:hypothetical protein
VVCVGGLGLLQRCGVCRRVTEHAMVCNAAHALCVDTAVAHTGREIMDPTYYITTMGQHIQLNTDGSVLCHIRVLLLAAAPCMVRAHLQGFW